MRKVPYNLQLAFRTILFYDPPHSLKIFVYIKMFFIDSNNHSLILETVYTILSHLKLNSLTLLHNTLYITL